MNKYFDDRKNWTLYLTRPFSLFVCSLWKEWYTYPPLRELAGDVIPDTLYVEEQENVARCYRIKEEQDNIFANTHNLFLKKPAHCVELLRKGLGLNSEAEIIIKKKTRGFLFERSCFFP